METQEPAESAELYNHPFSGQVIGCAIEVHRHPGPDLLEAAYEQCLDHELHLSKIPFKVQTAMPVFYKRVNFDSGCRLDLLIDDFLAVELEAVEKISVKLLKHGMKKCAITNFSALSCVSFQKE